MNGIDTQSNPGATPYYLRPDGTVCETYEAGSVLLSCHPALHPSYVTEDGLRYFRSDLVRRSICPACGREGRLRVDL